MVTDFLASSFAPVELGSLTLKEGMASLSQSGLLLEFLSTASGRLHFLLEHCGERVVERMKEAEEPSMTAN